MEKCRLALVLQARPDKNVQAGELGGAVPRLAQVHRYDRTRDRSDDAILLRDRNTGGGQIDRDNNGRAAGRPNYGNVVRRALFAGAGLVTDTPVIREAGA